jgi:hypothetical protein
MPGPGPRTSPTDSKNARPSQHDLLRLMVTEHAAVMNETLLLIREVRDLISHVAALVDAEHGSAAH